MSTEPANKAAENALSTRSYYNISQYRTDLWSMLKSAAMHLVKSRDTEAFADAREKVEGMLKALAAIESYWAYPGKERMQTLEKRLQRGEYNALVNDVTDLLRNLVSKSYFFQVSNFEQTLGDPDAPMSRKEEKRHSQERDAHYFEVLIVDDLSEEEEHDLRTQIAEVGNPEDKFRYEVVVVHTMQDALIALLFNYNIQSVVIRYRFPFESINNLDLIGQFCKTIFTVSQQDYEDAEVGPFLGNVIKKFRPELDLYLVTDTSLNRLSPHVTDYFRRVFYRQEDMQEMHLSILKGISERYETPFFTALKNYSKQPTGVFHAMPVSRGNSIFKSHWIRDMGEFYGRNIFLAETSATTGGLDSLLQPTGPLKKSQELASRAYGSERTYFVTNGTSTANKIVSQALVHPGDVVIIDRDCHKSHHYAMVLNGSETVYLDSFHNQDYAMYGGVPLSEIRQTLLDYKEKGLLHKVKMLVLTNCTFDGFVYNVEMVMKEVLAIKPDMIFLWDEAWWAFAGFTNIFRKRTAMRTARSLIQYYQSDEYRTKYEASLETAEPLPSPEDVRIRVYATQSTHKTLTSLRQGSMIHVIDQDFRSKVEDAFHEAYMTHTSTSPSYQILASLDIGRRQVELEGYEMVENSIERAMILRSKIANTPILRKYFDILTVEDLIPSELRSSGLTRYYSEAKGWTDFESAWLNDEFALDPTKINLYIGRTGIDGDTFKKRFLMDQFGIQVNKTSKNTVLFMTNIGTTRSSVAFLIGVLMKIAHQLDEKERTMGKHELAIHEQSKVQLTGSQPPLPDFSYFHDVFRSHPEMPGGNIRDAYFIANREEKCEYLNIEACRKAMEAGREIVAASFVTPYPPGFPVLVPGQVISEGILSYMSELDIKEIHSYRPELGFKVIREDVIEELRKSKEHENTLQNV